ncbi:MAG: hypothetical protein P8Y40_02975, partial [Desulfobacterales bacterium]
APLFVTAAVTALLIIGASLYKTRILAAGGGRVAQQMGGTPGAPGGAAGGGPLTKAEQVAILDAQLERGTGEVDSMIVEEQTAQRRAARERDTSDEPPGQGDETGAGPVGGYGPEGGVAGAGGYSTGGGMGGASRGGGAIPPDTAKFPPPADIPDGDDDDVVARQLREAAMREPDPAVREKLWDEYRKYKGIER